MYAKITDTNTHILKEQVSYVYFPFFLSRCIVYLFARDLGSITRNPLPVFCKHYERLLNDTQVIHIEIIGRDGAKDLYWLSLQTYKDILFYMKPEKQRKLRKFISKFLRRVYEHSCLR